VGTSPSDTRAASGPLPLSHASLAVTDDGLPVNVGLPPTLSRLLDARSAHEADVAWRAFMGEHSRLVLHVCRSVWHSHDDAMDAYAQVLEHLRANDYRRLHEFARTPRSKVSTWLVVVARRICLDLYRRRYGRPGADGADEQRRTRRRLQDLVAEQLELHDYGAPEGDAADAPLRSSELHDALMRALGELPARDLLLLKLRFADELPAQEIARLISLPTPFHVYRRLNALFAELKEALHRRGVESAAP
jgi:RNA polymerase sigma factor (sigma-70 family)